MNHEPKVYREQVPMPTGHPWVLPWPMTTREAAGYITILCVFVVASFAGVLWLSAETLPRSLWRIVPILAWAALLKWVLVPRIVPLFSPKDADERATHE